MSDQVLNAPTY